MRVALMQGVTTANVPVAELITERLPKMPDNYDSRPDNLVHEAVEEACKRNPQLVLEPYYQMKAAALILAEKILQLTEELEQEQASHKPIRNHGEKET